MGLVEKVKEGDRNYMPRRDVPPEEKVFQAWLNLTPEQRRSLGLMIRGCDWSINRAAKEVAPRKRAPRAPQAMPLTGTE